MGIFLVHPPDRSMARGYAHPTVHHQLYRAMSISSCCNALLLLQRRSDQRALMPNCLGRVRIVLPFESRRRKSRNVSQATLSSDFTLCVKKVSIRTSLNGENVCCADTFMGIPMKPIISKKSKLCSKEIGRKRAPPPLYPPLSSCALHWPNRR